MSGSPAPLRLVVFDCDGTLVDSQSRIVASAAAAWQAVGRPAPPAEAIRRFIGLPLEEAIRRLAPDWAAADHERASHAYRVAFASEALRAAEEPLYPGALEALARLEEEGALLGVATGKGSAALAETLGRHDLLHRFVTVQTADHGPGKPNPDMLHRAMDETGAEPAHTIMVGDTTYDMEMARNAGVQALGVAWGYHPASELVEAGAEHVVKDYPELGKWLMA